jgi:hypothetical protein
MLKIDGKVYKFNVFSEAIEFMVGIDKQKFKNYSNLNTKNLISRKDVHKNEEGESPDLKLL